MKFEVPLKCECGRKVDLELALVQVLMFPESPVFCRNCLDEFEKQMFNEMLNVVEGLRKKHEQYVKKNL